MPSHMHRETDRSGKSPGRVVKPSDDKDKSHKNVSKPVSPSSEDDAVPFNQLTLYDLGGPSDALGG